MDAFLILMPIYVVPAAILVGLTIAVVLVRRHPVLHAFEYVSWLLPGFTYWFLGFGGLDPLQTLRGNAVATLGEPGVVGVIAGFLFIARAVIGARNPRWNRITAVSCVIVSNLAAVGVFVFTPTLLSE